MHERTTPKPRLNAQDRRASILEAAGKLFSEKGFRGATTRELAAAIGVSEPVLYEHFRTKKDLYTAIIDSKSQEGLARLTQLQNDFLAREDDREFFTKLAETVANFHREHPEYLRLLLFSALEGHELSDVMHQRLSRAFLDIVSAYIKRRVAQGAMRPIDPQLAARIFTGAIAQHCQTALLLGPGVQHTPQSEVIAGIVDVALYGMLSPSSHPCAERQ